VSLEEAIFRAGGDAIFAAGQVDRSAGGSGPAMTNTRAGWIGEMRTQPA